MSEVVFKLGPLERPAGNVSAYFVYPGREGQRTFFGSDDAAVLQEIAAVYGAAELSVQAQLADAAGPLGIATRGLTVDESKQVGVMALELALPGVFSGIEDPAIFHHIAIAAKIFFEAAPWKRALAYETIEIDFTGSVSRSMSARILGVTRPGVGVVLYDDERAVEAIVHAVERGAWAEVAGMSLLGITLEQKPRFAVEAMERMYGLPRVPAPLRRDAGEPVPLDDADGLILAATLRALSVLNDEEKQSHAQVKTDDLEVWALASLSSR